MKMDDEITILEAMFLPEEYKIDLSGRFCEVEISSLDSTASLRLSVTFPIEYPIVPAKPRLSRMRLALDESKLSLLLEKRAIEDAKDGSLTFCNLIEICKEAISRSHPPCSICLDTVICETWITLTPTSCQHSFHSKCLFRFIWEVINTFLHSDEEIYTQNKQIQKQQELTNELKSALDLKSTLLSKVNTTENVINDLTHRIDDMLKAEEEGKKSNARHSKRHDVSIIDSTELQRQRTLALSSLKLIEESNAREMPLLEAKIQKAKAAIDLSDSSLSLSSNLSCSSKSLQTHLIASSTKLNLLHCPQCRTLFPFTLLGKNYEKWARQNHETLLKKESDIVLPATSFDLDEPTREYLIQFKATVKRFQQNGGNN